MRNSKLKSLTLLFAIFIMLFVLVTPAFAYSIRTITFYWSSNYDGSIVMSFDATGNYNWVTSGRLTPLPEANFGAWKFGSINGWNYRYMVVGAVMGEVYRICLGVSDSDPGSGNVLYQHANNRCFKVWRTGGTNLSWKEIFNVYGRVTNSSASPISGVTVSNGAGRTALTNNNGDYSFLNLEAGSYALTASKSGYTFSPGSRTVSGGPPFHITGQDFVGTVLPSDTTDPSGNITSPATGITVGPGTVHLEANAWDNPGGSGVKHVEFWVRYDSTWHRVKDEYHPPYEADWQIPAGLASQDIQIGIHVVDNAGNVAVDPGGKRTIHYVASASCTVPYFSQRDSRWINHPLRTNGVCSSYCNTIGRCGCTLTSSAMLFKYYDANLTPASLSDCMGTAACPFYWGTGAACSGGKAQWRGKSTFTWSRLERELNQNGRPVIVGMHKGADTHWVVALSGSGSRTANYTIHDPWPINGANMKLSAYSTWWLDWIAVYDGHPACGSLTAATTDEVPRPQPVIAATNPDLAATQETLTIIEAQGLTTSAVVTGSAWLYRMTDVTMTVQLIAGSGTGNVTEMLVWTDSMTQTTWQSFSSFVYLPRSDEIYARFRDESENVSATKSDTLYPVASPVTAPSEVFLPLVTKQ
ncbi:MAG: carboxypeptidase regulatory-like domain-containing protein [Chloroflexota bacterium]|nr:carboxypeptidase regulatory-like domain-containing protein [Chloroflexota bacterium]